MDFLYYGMAESIMKSQQAKATAKAAKKRAVSECDKFAVEMVYNVEPPTRKTFGAAGYDVCNPVAVVLTPGTVHRLYLGFKIKSMPAGTFLTFKPRSSLALRGFNVLEAVIDSDYLDREVFAMVTVERELVIEAGERVVQAIILNHFAGPCYATGAVTRITNPTDARNGGSGSTGK